MKKHIIEIKSHGFPVVKTGQANNVSEFYDKIIKSQFSAKEAIKSIHKTLMEYVEEPKAIFALRLFGSDSKKNYNNLRRGFLTQYPNGKRMVFCDNTFAMPFAALKCVGTPYALKELEQYMDDSSTRLGFGFTKEEKELAVYNWSGNKATINLNSYGWYLAHIIPVGKSYLGKNLRDYFDNPMRSEWTMQQDHIRRPQVDLTDIECSILKAHFLRIVHPLNSFVVPKRRLLAYEGNNIGEEIELINFVREQIKDEFTEEYSEFSDKALISENANSAISPIDPIGEIVWSDSESLIKKEKSKIRSARRIRSMSSPKSYVNNMDDVYNVNPEERLENVLRSIGKEAFVKLYSLLKKNNSLSVEDIYEQWPAYKDYSLNSQNTRLSSTRSIINQGLDREALIIIANSSHLSQNVREEAEKLLVTL